MSLLCLSKKNENIMLKIINYKHMQKGFNLSEILITLSIIGVVSAITLPNFIYNYKKSVLENRLKAAQSIINQALTLAQAEYGDPATWDFTKTSGQQGDPKPIIANAVEKYFLPYLKEVKKGGYKSLSDAGYSEPYKFPYNQNQGELLQEIYGARQYIIQLVNEVNLFITLNGYTKDGIYYHGNMLIIIDINGNKPPNEFGRDTFVGQINSNSGRFSWYLLTSVHTHEKVLQHCKNSPMECGALIEVDGYKILKDYPYRI